MKVQFDGLDQLLSKLRALTPAVEEQLAEVLQEHLYEIQQGAVELAPFKDGVLEGEIKGEMIREGDNLTVAVGASRPVEGGRDIALWLHERTDAPLGHESPPAPGWGPGTAGKKGWGGRPAGHKFLEYPLLQQAPKLLQDAAEAVKAAVQAASQAKARRRRGGKQPDGKTGVDRWIDKIGAASARVRRRPE